jgi:hypothetical protein
MYIYICIYVYIYIWAISHGHIYFLHAVNVTQYKYDASTSSDKLDLPNRQIEAKKFKKIGISMETFRVLKKKTGFLVEKLGAPSFSLPMGTFPRISEEFLIIKLDPSVSRQDNPTASHASKDGGSGWTSLRPLREVFLLCETWDFHHG